MINTVKLLPSHHNNHLKQTAKAESVNFVVDNFLSTLLTLNMHNYLTEVMETQKINFKNLARFVQCQSEPIKPSSRQIQQSFRVNVVVLGSSGCGKTAVIKRFLGKPLPKTHIPTLEDVYDGHYTLKSFHTTVLLRIYDTDGSDRFPAMRNLAISEGQAFIIMYKLNSKESFKIAKETVDEVLQAKGEGVPIYLVGNKCDKPSTDHVVATDESIAVSREKKCYFAVTSAFMGINIDKVFRELALQMVERRSLRVDERFKSSSLLDKKTDTNE